MKLENVIKEWTECRNAIARFDDYLLKIRLTGFSIFTLTFTAIAGVSGGLIEKIVGKSDFLVLADFILSIFILAVYFLDRYYERMLLVAVLRASRLESHRLEGYRIGLTTEIEFQKSQIKKPFLFRTIGKASFMVNLVYLLMLVSIWAQYVMLSGGFQLTRTYAILFLAMIVLSAAAAVAGNYFLVEPNRLIKKRAQIVNSPVLISREEIRHTISRLAGEIVAWIGKAEGDTLHLIPILIGARPFAQDIVDELKRRRPKLDLYIHIIHMGSAEGTQDSPKESRIICGLINNELLKDKPVLILDDFVETGGTIGRVLELVKDAQARDIKTAVLIRKFSKESLVVPDFVGFDLGLDPEKLPAPKAAKCCLFGYGMDYEGHYRELDHIGWVLSEGKET